MNTCVYQSASHLWSWVIKIHPLMPISAKTCTHIHTEVVGQNVTDYCTWPHTYTMVRCKRKLSHMSKRVACKKLTHYVTIKILPTFLNTTICSLSGSNCAHYNILRCWSEFTLFFPQFRL